MSSVTLYRISNADLSDSSIQATIDSDDRLPSEIPTTRDVPCRLFIFRDPPETPEWVQYLATIAARPLGVPTREAVGAILVIKPVTRGRTIYAATWGSGRFHLRSGRLESDWGLRCALNLLSGDRAGDRRWDPARVRALRSKRVSQNTLIAEIQSSRRTTIDAFPFSADIDQLRRVTGTPINSSRFGSTVTGGTSIHLKRKSLAKDLLALTQEIEQVYNSTDYRRHFGWIDNVSQINDETTITQYYERLVTALRNGRLHSLNLCPPTLIQWDDISKFAYQWGHIREELDEPSIETFCEFLKAHNLLPALSAGALRERPRLHALNDDGQKIQSWLVSRCLSAEFKIGADTYILDDGALLLVAPDYLRALNKLINAMSDAQQSFPAMRRNEKEDSYNRRISQSFNRSILLDKQTVRRPNGTAIEVCDVATGGRQLIHVKKGTSSSSLSHLFAQGVVSAELLHMDTDFRQELSKLLSARRMTGSGSGRMRDFSWLRDSEFDSHTCEVVYAIMTERRSGMRKDKLPFFSKINLRMRYNELRRMGFKCSLALVSL